MAHGRRMALVSCMHGAGTAHARRLCGACMTLAWQLHAHAWRLYGACMAHAWSYQGYALCPGFTWCA
eukprot:363223-Chlamydomonas_euryale.AAC.4